MKRLIALTIFSFMPWFMFFFTPEPVVYDGDSEAPEENVMAQKKLHLAMEKIMDKKHSHERSPLSTADNYQSDSDIEVIDDSSYRNKFFENEFQEELNLMTEQEIDQAFVTLQSEVEGDQRLLEQMENERDQGLNITTDDIEAIAQRTENKKQKWAYLMSKMNQGESYVLAFNILRKVLLINKPFQYSIMGWFFALCRAFGRPQPFK